MDRLIICFIQSTLEFMEYLNLFLLVIVVVKNNNYDNEIIKYKDELTFRANINMWNPLTVSG